MEAMTLHFLSNQDLVPPLSHPVKPFRVAQAKSHPPVSPSPSPIRAVEVAASALAGPQTEATG